MTRLFIAVLVLLALAAPVVCFADKPVNDGVITDKVRQRLVSDPEVKGYAVDVDTKDGVVTLSGKVETKIARDKAEKLAKKVSGVKSVINKLVVEPPQPPK